MKSFTALTDVEAYRFVKLNSENIETAASSTDSIIGISDSVSTSAGDVLDVYTLGEIGMVEAGGSFSEGDALTSDSEGKAVKAVSGDNIGAIAILNGVSGDIIPCIISIQRTLTESSDTTEDTTEDETEA